jgi:hypothetical protein
MLRAEFSDAVKKTFSGVVLREEVAGIFEWWLLPNKESGNVRTVKNITATLAVRKKEGRIVCPHEGSKRSATAGPMYQIASYN